MTSSHAKHSRVAIPAPAGYALLRAHQVGSDYEVDAVPVILLEVARVHDPIELREVVAVGLNGDRSGDEDAAVQVLAGQVVAHGGDLYRDVDAWLQAIRERDRLRAKRAAARLATGTASPESKN